MTRSLFSLLFTIALLAVCIHACKPEVELSGPDMKLTALTLNDKNKTPLNSILLNVPNDFNFVATFDNSIDFRTVTKYSVSILHVSDTATGAPGDTVKINYIIDGAVLYIAPASLLLTGAKLKLTITDSVASFNGHNYEGTVVYFTTVGVGIDTPPDSERQILYLQFDGSVKDLTQRDSVVVQNLSYTDDRYGFASLAASFTATTTPGSGNITELMSYRFKPNANPPAPVHYPPVISGAMTISTWINIAGLDYKSDTIPSRAILGMSAELGYYFELTADANGPLGLVISTDHKVGSAYKYYQDVYPKTGSMASYLSDGWHHLAMTYDTTNKSYKKLLYIDGVVIDPISPSNATGPMALAGDSTTVGLNTNFTVGYYCSKLNTSSRLFNYTTATNTFVGALDDLRVFRVALTYNEIQALYKQESPGL